MRKAFNVKKFFKYLLTLLGYFLFTILDGEFSPFSLALLTANLFIGLKPLICFILYSAPFLLSFSAVTIAVSVFGGGVLCLIFAIYKRRNAKPSLETVGYLAVALTPYCIFSASHPLPIKLIISSAIILSSFILTQGVKIWIVKGLKYKLSSDDFLSASFLAVVCGYGLIIAFGEGFYFGTALLSILLSGLLIGGLSPLLTSVVTAIPIAIFRVNFTPLSIAVIYACAISLTCSKSKLLTTVLTAAVTTCLYFSTDYFSGLPSYSPFISTAFSVVYLFFPERLAERLRDDLKVHRAENINRYSINLHRNLIAGKLFEFASVFSEMACSVENLKRESPQIDKISSQIANGILNSICADCVALSSCRKNKFPQYDDLKKVVSLGIAKGGLNLVDLPKNFSENCQNAETLLRFANESILNYRVLEEENSAIEQGKTLLVKQTKGLSDALKGLATDACKQLEVNSKSQKKLTDNLLKCGIAVKELSHFKSGDEEEIVAVLSYKDSLNPLFLKAIGEITGYKPIITTNNRISETLSAVTVKRSPRMDAAFGISSKTKDDKQKSGDTHSVTKINEGKFLIAMSDGMGSGEKAEETSANAISLIETFYKAGLSSDVVLPIVNNLLSFNGEDNFTAMDVGIVNLFSGGADFIKIGSPYSFILTKDSVKIIEGNSLPLGILEEMRPTVCKTNLLSGDVIVFLSDGITDAFASSSDLIDFLSTQRALNPKTLADNILEKALFLNGGVAKDDMTAFCVRIFSKSA